MPSPAPNPDIGAWDRLPAVEQAERWEQVVPGSAARMVRQIEADLAHQRRLATLQMVLQAIGSLIGAGAVVAYVWIAKSYLDHGEATAGAGILGSGAVGVAGIFVGRKIGRGTDTPP
ncbi:hypothetical protein GCM10009665_25590 [Kitasatospora nipponensis]|uniref:Superfamily III holin-X n=1 Tax=Kitasatospora nipponensis TaxID=258049 RepID=A0ABN1W4I1_9ACTN